MQWTDVKRNWAAMDRALMTRWPQLQEERLAEVDGDRAALEAEIARAEGLAPEEARRQLAEWLNGPMPADIYADPRHDNAAIADSARHLPPGEEPLDDDKAFGDDEQPDRPIGRRR